MGNRFDRFGFYRERGSECAKVPDDTPNGSTNVRGNGAMFDGVDDCSATRTEYGAK